MSYKMTHRRIRVRHPKPALSGVIDTLQDVIAGATGTWGILAQAQSQCSDAVTAQVASLHAYVDNLQATWNPTGYYSPDDFKAATSAALQLAATAKDTLAKAPTPGDDSQKLIDAAVNNITDQTQKGLGLIQQYIAAVNSGATVIDAPGLKQYVIDSMQASYDGLTTAAMLNCQMPWLATAIIQFQNGFDIVWGVVTKIAGVIANVGDLVYKVSGDLGEIWTVVKWGALIGGAAWLAIKLGEMRRKAHKT